MARVFWPANDDDFLPSSLTRVSFSNITVDLDTSKHYIQGQLLIKNPVYCNPRRRWMKIVLSEDVSDTKLSLFLINDMCDKCQSINVGDVMTLTGFTVHTETHVVPSDYHCCYVMAMPSNPSSLTVWIIPDARSGNRESSGVDHGQPEVECEDGSSQQNAGRADLADRQNQTMHTADILTQIQARTEPEGRNSSPSKTPAAVGSLVGSVHNSTAHSPRSSDGTRRVTHGALASSSESHSVITHNAVNAAQTADKQPSRTASPAKRQAPSSPKKDSRSSPVKTTASQSSGRYIYTAIKDIKAETSVNVYGVVKFVRPPSKGRGMDYSILLSIVDESLTGPLDKLKCMLFARDVHSLPDANVGDIIRLHRLKISTYKNELQGQNGPGFAWVLFDNLPDAASVPRSTSTPNFTLTDDDVCRVTELINWASDANSLLSQDAAPASAAHSLVSLSSVTINMYFDLVCQVVAVCVLTEGTSMLLRVWDGTKISVPTYEQDMTEEPELVNRLVSDQSLVRAARGYVVDLWVYDDHFAAAKSIKPSDLVSLTNVHAMIHKSGDTDQIIHRAVPMVELCIHGGGTAKYGRGVAIVDDTLPAVQRLKLLLTECIDDRDSDSDEDSNTEVEDIRTITSAAVDATHTTSVPSNEPVADMANVRDLTSGGLKRSYCNRQSSVKKQKVGGNDSGSRASGGSQPTGSTEDVVMSSSLTSDRRESDERFSAENGEDRCLLNTSTVVTGEHRGVKRTCLSDVLVCEPPSKFRVCADVIKYMPRAECPLDIIQLYCSVCKFLSQVPSDDSADDSFSINNRLSAHLHRVDNGVSIYMCPQCSRTSRPGGTRDVVCLKYVYMLEFVLDDGSGWLSAGLCKDEAVPELSMHWRTTSKECHLLTFGGYKTLRGEYFPL